METVKEFIERLKAFPADAYITMYRPSIISEGGFVEAIGNIESIDVDEMAEEYGFEYCGEDDEKFVVLHREEA